MKLKRTTTILAFFALALVGYAFQATFIQDGDAIDYAPDVNTNVEAGEVVIIGDLVAVAKYDIPSNTVGAVSLRGVSELAKPVGAIPQALRSTGTPAKEMQLPTQNQIRCLAWPWQMPRCQILLSAYYLIIQSIN